jgi:mevalonate pyrophosphate decarboxylase
MGNKKPKAYTFTKNAGPQFKLLTDAEPMDSFILFFSDEFLNNIVIETNKYTRHNIPELQLSL